MVKANVAETRVVPAETKVRPFYDDFNEDKNFHRLVFRPGNAVQARELTQIQTMLQNQIERFGLHIFKNGSSVIGGDLSITKTRSLNLSPTYIGTTISAADFIGKTVKFGDANNDVIARVINASESTATEPPTLHLKYLTGQEFSTDQTIKVEGEEVFANTVGTANVAGFSQLAFIYDSIYFYNGFFIKVPQQNIVIDKYTGLANTKVGLELDDSIITSDSDASLLDPALEASNYQGTGAARYVIELNLSKRDLDSTDDTAFIEIARIENGGFNAKVQYPIYSEIEEVFARRTYDESGSYTVNPFILRMDDDPTDNANNVLAVLSPGKAYVKGYEYETIGENKIQIPRARSNTAITNYDLNLNYGQYVIVDDLEGVFDPTNQPLVDIHDVPWTSVDHSSSGNYNASKIGVCRVRDLEFFSGDTVVADRKHELYIFDAKFTGNNSFAQANSFVSSVSYTPGAVDNANAEISTLNFDNGLANGNAFIFEPSLRKLVFPFPEKYVVEGSLANPSFRFRKRYSSVQFTSGTSAAITAGTDEQFVGDSSSSNVASTVTDNFLVIVTNNQGGARANGEQIKVRTAVSGSPEQVVFDTDNGADNFLATVLAKMEVDGGSAAQRSKTITLANTSTVATEAIANTITNPITGSSSRIYPETGQVVINNPTKQAGVKESLYLSDVIAVKKIYDKGTTGFPTGGASMAGYTDITDRYELDTGQRDTHYDHAAIKLKPGFQPPAGAIVVCCRLYKSTSGDSGYFSVDSYPSLATEIIEEGVSLGTGYAIIPKYTSSDGEELFLRDCIDFRPVRRNSANGFQSTVGFNSSKVPVAATDFQSDYNYYLGRRDLIVLTSNREMKRVQGVPGKYPQNPSKPTGSMVLYALGVSPYTAYPSNVAVEYVDNRRYTMRDIGLIDRRLKNVEYYVALNNLEKAALDLIIKDVDGLERTKNGILADNFNDHSLGASDRFDYQIAVDFKQGRAQPKANNESIKQVVDESSINNVEVLDEKILLDYTEEPFVAQNAATKFTAVAEFLFADYEGTIITIPEADIWKATNVQPTIINTTFENNQSFDTITVRSQGQATQAINDIIGGDTRSRNRSTWTRR